MTRIEGQIAAEAGEDWRTDPEITRGRDAVRAEHGLPPLGAVPPQSPGREKRRRWRRLLGG